MLYLWTSIFCSSLIYLTFKLSSTYKASSSGIIIINYFTAFLLGLIITSNNLPLLSITSKSWFPMALLIGLLFVVMFALIGWSTIKAGISITTLATRMSMIIPIGFSMFYFKEENSILKIVTLSLALVAVLLALIRKRDSNKSTFYLLLPFILFIGSGTVDSLVKAAQHIFIAPEELGLFSGSLFGIAFCCSLILLLRRNHQNSNLKATIAFGILLGLVNFGSLFFLIKALNNSNIDSSIIFGINNLAIVSISLLIGTIAFKEKLSGINWVGIALSIFCILIFTII